MPGIVREGDTASPCPTCPTPTVCIEFSSDTHVNNRGLCRNGDKAAPHCGHERPSVGGSTDSYCNNRNIMRHGDMVACGGIWVTSSSDSYCN